MSFEKPKVSIGLPVYNGENYLEIALQSLLSQTFEDFELIISDNMSTDRTSEICEKYVQRDKRVRYVRNSHNIGASRNFNSVFELAKGEYFKWAAHDDLLAPTYLEKCVHILDSHPDVVICHSYVNFIDEHGEFIKEYDIYLNKINSPKTSDRFGDLIMMHHWCFDIFGLIRSDVLHQTDLIANFVNSDRNLLVHLGLIGRYYIIPERLFFSRAHPGQSIKIDLYDRATWFDPLRQGKPDLPRWVSYLDYFKLLKQVSLSRSERLKCYLHLLNWLRKHGKGLVKDLLMVGMYYFRPRTKHKMATISEGE